jgi:hypothetical protein
MRNEYQPSLVRRSFLRFSILGGLVALTGCDSGEPTQVTTPALPKGNRSRLEGLKNKAAGGAAKPETGKDKEKEKE